jgi:hypothetical protein
MTIERVWESSSRDERSKERIDRMTGALQWLRQSEDSYVVFDCAGSNRYVQFAGDMGSGDEDAVEDAVAIHVPVPVHAAAATGGAGVDLGSIAHPVTHAPPWAGRGAYFGEPDHKALTMEVASGLWPESSPRGLAGDDTVIAKLAALGLHLGGGRHSCRNFCRSGVTEPSDILAALSEDVMVDALHADPGYSLTIKRGHF